MLFRSTDLLVSRVFDLIKYPYDKKRFDKLTMIDWAKQELTLTLEEDDEFEFERLTIRISEVQNGVVKKMVVRIEEDEDYV